MKLLYLHLVFSLSSMCQLYGQANELPRDSIFFSLEEAYKSKHRVAQLVFWYRYRENDLKTLDISRLDVFPNLRKIKTMMVDIVNLDLKHLPSIEVIEFHSAKIDSIYVSCKGCRPNKLKYATLTSIGSSTISCAVFSDELAGLSISGDNFTGLEGGCDFEGLQALIISDTQMKSIEDWAISDVMETLWLKNNQIKEIPEELYKAEKLKLLQLENNSIENISKDIARLKNLEELYLNGNPISELPFTSITQLDKLDRLVLPKIILETQKDSVSFLKEKLPNCSIH